MAPAALLDTPLPIEPFKSKHVAPRTEGSLTSGVRFEPSRHLAYSPPSSILTMKDLGYEDTPLSPIATTEPFPFLSREGLLQHRRDLFCKETLDHCLVQSRPGAIQIRGMAPRYTPFIHQFWNSPEVLKIVSDIAGVELIPALDYETCHTNIQLGAGGVPAVHNTSVEPPEATEEAIRAFEQTGVKNEEDTDQNKAIVGAHRDSHPWVCVVMLSDARNMSGGETELVKGDGSTMKVRAPQMGYAVMLQGRYITHTALPMNNMPERITIVTSFRPKNPLLVDDMTNMNVRNKSHLSELFYQWTTYRLDVMAQRAQLAAQALRERYEKNILESDPQGKGGLCMVDTVDQEEMHRWAEGMMQYIEKTLHEIRPIEDCDNVDRLV